jgi:hypothetical protein
MRPKRKLFTPKGRFRAALFRFVHSGVFENATSAAIVVNTVIMAMQYFGQVWPSKGPGAVYKSCALRAAKDNRQGRPAPWTEDPLSNGCPDWRGGDRHIAARHAGAGIRRIQPVRPPRLALSGTPMIPSWLTRRWCSVPPMIPVMADAGLVVMLVVASAGRLLRVHRDGQLLLRRLLHRRGRHQASRTRKVRTSAT